MSQDLIFIAISLFTWGLGETAFLSFQPLYLQQLGADPLEIGAIISGFAMAGALTHVPAGYLADRIGRRPMMIAAWVIGLVATTLMALCTSLPLFVFGVLIYGTTMFVMAPMNSYVTAARGRLSVGRALTFISASYNLGMILGPLIGGYLASRFGFRSIYIFAACIFIPSTSLIFFIRPQPVEPRVANQRPLRGLFKNSPYVRFAAMYFVISFAMFLPQPLAPNFLQDQRGLSLETIGQLYSLNGIGIVALNLILGQLDSRLGFFLGQIAVGFFSLFLWVGTGLPWYFCAYLLLGGYKAARSLATAQVRSLVEQNNMGVAYGALETVSSAAVILAPLFAGWLYERNPISIYPASLVMILLALGTTLLFMYTHPAASPISEETLTPGAETGS